jgi:hypothetical protein
MTELDNTQDNPIAEEPKRSKRGLIFSSSILCVVAAAATTAFLGVPKEMSWDYSRFVVPLKAETFEVNLADEGRRRYLVMDLIVDVRSYNEEATRAWVADPICVSYLDHAVNSVGSAATMDEVYDITGPDGVQGKLFMEQIRASVERVLFAVQCGDAPNPMIKDSFSGLAPGISNRKATLRGPLSEHSIQLDCISHTIQFDDGDVYTFDGTEDDFHLTNAAGDSVYVDLTAVELDFIGSVPVGVSGRILSVLKRKFVVQ